MFPKCHAVAYVMMAVRIAYSKLTTYFTVRADEFNTEIVVKGEWSIKRKMDELYAMGNNITQKDKGLLTILELSYEIHKRGMKFQKLL
jgi:DNA polymerase-3 subunit alpha (Gram-positive type)